VTAVDDAVYVYGVLRASELGSVSVAGVEESEVRGVEHGGLAALTSRVTGGALAAAREVRAHWRVLEEASKNATVLPVRFGTVLESDDEVRARLLEPNADSLTALLEEVAGCVQLSVKGDYEEEPLLREVVRTSPAVAELRERISRLPEAAGYYDRIRLGELVAAEVARCRVGDTRHALDSLQPHAVAAKEEDPTHPNAAFNLQFLVAREKQPAFSRQVGKLADELGRRVDIRYVGPLPPYSFAEADLSAGSEAWA
jgi:hypothetical protein